LQQRSLQPQPWSQPQLLSQPHELSQPQALSQPQPWNKLKANAWEALQARTTATTAAKTRFIMGGAPQ
jgi:hypothetical protein